MVRSYNSSATGPARERYEAHVKKGPDCWIWTGYLNPAGYGKFFADGRKVFVHRWAYAEFVGPIPEGIQVDHRCRVTQCVNPAHLRLATNKQNCEHRGPRVDNTSGFPGVSFHRKTQRWQASVGHEGRRIYLGLYDTAAEAAEIARAKRLELFTHNDNDRI